MDKLERHPDVQRHIREAKEAGKCVQCQNPWFDGMCLCGKYGEKEKGILRVVNLLLDASDEEFEREIKRKIEEEVREIDASLKSVSELEWLWEKKAAKMEEVTGKGSGNES